MANANIEYTVTRTAKMHKEKVRDARPSIWLSVAKWIVALFLVVAVLTCTVASKICFISVGRQESGTTHQKETTPFIMLVLVLMLPEAVALIRSSWGSLFRSSHPWPSWRAIAVGLVASICEVVGLCYFTVAIVMQADVPAGYCILVMNGLFLVPVGWQIRKVLKNQEESSRKQLGCFIFALLFGIGGLVGLTFRVHVAYSLSWESTVAIPVSMLLLSFAWCPGVRRTQLEARCKPAAYADARDVLLGGSNGVLPPAPPEKPNGHSARAKATIIASLVKLLLIPFVAAGFFKWLIADIFGGNLLHEGFDNFNVHHSAFPYFMVQIFASLVGYCLGCLVCSMCMQKLAFAFPLVLSTIVSVAITPVLFPHSTDINNVAYLIILAVLLWLSQFLSTGYYLFKGQSFIMAKESSLFWLPAYNGAFLEQSLLLNRKSKVTDGPQVDRQQIARDTCVYICTTMYREVETEMEQLLKSLNDIDTARAVSRRQIESHVFFDGAVKGDVMNNFVLQLISLIPKTLKVTENCMKLKTPYGLQLRWRLPGGMLFHIHLKDNLKVKNKKRWSQVMYMSYVLDYKERQMEVNDRNTYILTTDADVKFTHESVEALLDLMMRDPSVGAVCGRTHPLGVGPVVWYQVFDYAIGHWFQKVANDVLGSVLCCPGCFSVYRAEALRDVLPIYATGVDNSYEFLTKDMGEDRWLCTLMVQSGWRLEYCAAAEDSTYCPDNFDEFYKQRRRWIPSTLANLILLISEWNVIAENNDGISFFFILYQALMVFSTIISPATVILIMVGGLLYADVGLENEIAPTVLLGLVVVGFALICMYTKQDFQLKVAKILTVAFALLMAFVAVGVMAQVASDLYARRNKFSDIISATVMITTAVTPTTNTTKPFYATPTTTVTTTATAATTAALSVEEQLPADLSTMYLIGLIAIFFAAALLHLPEAFCLMHGIWYLLCLPSGYMLLLIYSICNLTDRSWGTREEKVKKADEEPWYQTLWRKILSCCRPQAPPQPPPVPDARDGREIMIPRPGEEVSDSGSPTSEDESTAQEDQDGAQGPEPSATEGGAPGKDPASLPPEPAKSAMRTTPRMRPQVSIEETEDPASGKWRYPGEKKVTFSSKLPRLHSETPVEEWLQGDMLRLYADNFKNNGYDNVSFIAGMTDKDLKAIGISVRGHRRKLLHAIEYVPTMEIAQEVPDNVEDWLTKLGLDEYWPEFERNSYTEPRMLEDLKTMDKETLERDLNIAKPGHLKKLMKALKKIQYPTEAQRRIQRAREEINKVPVQDLRTSNQDDGLEQQFWEGLRQHCLLPETAGFGAVAELKEKLEDLRDSALMMFAITNSIWIILLMTLIKQEHLKLLGVSVLGLVFLCIYGFLIVLQFITLLWHRGVTTCHVVARAPWKRGQKMMTWSFDDAKLLPPNPTPGILEEIRRQRGRKYRRRRSPNRAASRRMSAENGDLREPLLSSGEASSHRDYSRSSTPHPV